MVTRDTIIGVKNVLNRSCKEKRNTHCMPDTLLPNKQKQASVAVMVCVSVLFNKQCAFFPCFAAWKIGMDVVLYVCDLLFYN